MSSLILLAATALGVDYGWQPNPGGGFEYIIQIEPELLDALRAGEALRSDLPPFMRDVRAYRIQVGRGEVPREGNPEAAAAQQPPATVQEPAAVPAAEPAREEPLANPARGGWSPYEDRKTPPMQPPRSEPRYPNYNLRTETTPPKLPANEPTPPRPVNDDSPRRFQPDPTTTPLVQTTGYGAPETKPSAAEAGPSAKPPAKTEEAKPWLPLTFTLLCLFVSLGGNAYLGLQWWSIRQRCQQLLRDRRLGGGPHASARKGERRFASDEDEADEDQDVRAISEDELARSKRRRNGA